MNLHSAVPPPLPQFFRRYPLWNNAAFQNYGAMQGMLINYWLENGVELGIWAHNDTGAAFVIPIMRDDAAVPPRAEWLPMNHCYIDNWFISDFTIERRPQ